ncbi:hypothetical protein R6Q57_009830 [Mikania cordata]
MNSLTLPSLSLSCICLAMLTLADEGSTSAPKANLYWPGKASVIDCEAAYLTLGSCYLEMVIAYRTRQVRILLGPSCCASARAFDYGCWPRTFGFNPFFPQFLRRHCSAFHGGLPTAQFGADQVAGLLGNDLELPGI